MLDAEDRPLDFPADGLVHDGLLYRMPRAEDVEKIAPAFADESIGGAANMPRLGIDELRAQLDLFPELIRDGIMLPLLVENAETGELYGGAVLHDFNWALGQVEIGYWLFPEAQGRGIATRIARFLAERGFAMGAERVEARVFVGNTASERVLERAGFTREGVLRSLPRRWGGRADMTVYSLLPGE